MKSIALFLVSIFILQPVFATNYLSKPTGQYAVGFQDFHFVNGTLKNGSYSCPGKRDLLYFQGINENGFGKDNQIDFCREVMVRFYYPIQNKQKLPYAKYYRPAINDIQTVIRDTKIPAIKEDQIKDLENIKTFSVNFTNKESNIVNKKFPVLIFDPGSGQEVQQYENIISDMVSHGYIVVAINNTFIGNSILFPDGRIVHPPTSVGDQTNALDRSALNDIFFIRQLLIKKVPAIENLIDHMQLKHIGLFGHSLGGISVVEAIKEQPDLFQAAVSLDVPPVGFGTREYSKAALAGFKNIPFLRFFGAEWKELLPDMHMPKDAKFELFSKNYYVLLSPSENNLTYSGHLSFSDYVTFQYQVAFQNWIKFVHSKLGFDPLLGTADGWQLAKIINDYLLDFFDQYLKNEPSKNLNKCIPLSKDTILECGSES